MEIIAEIQYCEIGVIPIDFIVDNIRYQKQFDGNYHKFIVGSPTRPDSSLGCIHIAEARKIFMGTRYKTPIIFCSDNVNVSSNNNRSIHVLSTFVSKFKIRIKNLLKDLE